MERTVEKLRTAFPALTNQVNGRPLTYLDNAATMQMPQAVLDSLNDFYMHGSANVHRGVHTLSEHATDLYEGARSSVASFLSMQPEEIILTSGTTDSLNRLARMVEPLIQPGDDIVVTQMEHHSNLLPWRQLAQRTGANCRFIPVAASGELDMEAADSLLGPSVKVLALTQLSNVTGIETDVARLAALAHECSDAFVVVDGAQGAVHLSAAQPGLGYDAYAFSGHKLGAPTGTGALAVRAEWLQRLQPCTFGGGTVLDVTDTDAIVYEGPAGHEAGTPNFAGFAGLTAALSFWAGQPAEQLRQHEQALLAHAQERFSKVPHARVLAPEAQHHGALSLAVDVASPFDWCKLLDAQGVAVRSGHHCAAPYLKALGVEHSLRISVAPYNTMEEIDACAEALLAAQAALSSSAPSRRRRKHG